MIDEIDRLIYQEDDRKEVEEDPDSHRDNLEDR